MNLLKQILTEAYLNKNKKVSFHFEKDYLNNLQSPVLSLDNPPHFNHLLNENMSKDDLQLLFGRKWKTLLGNLGSFVDIFQFVVTTKNYTPYVISQNSKRLNQVYKSQATVGRVLSLAVKVGLLSVAFDDTSYCKKLSKEYYYNKKVEKVIKRLVDRYDINYKKVVKNEIHSINGNHIRKDNGYKVKFSSKLRISNMTESEVLDSLYEKYPTLAKYQEMANEMNEDLPFEQQITYTPNINKTSKGYISKIGIRATSSLCPLKVHENENKDYSGKWRDEYLDEYFGKNNWYENDVKSSVPRVAYLLKTGKWEDQSIDMYEKVFGKFDNENDREIYKSFFMKFYFDRANSIFNHNKEYIPEAVEKYGKGICKDILASTAKKITTILGESKDNEIFFHESNIYLTFVKWLRSKGIKVVQIYDGFFSNVDTSKYNYKLKEIAENYYNEINKVEVKKEEEHSINGNHIRNNEVNYEEISKLADLALNIGSVNINIIKEQGENTHEY